MENALVCAYILDSKGGAKEIGWDEIQSWSKDQGILWVHLDYTTKKAKNWLLKESGLDKITARAMIAEESRPRCVITSGGILTFLRSVNSNPGQDPEDMVSIRTWIDRDRIITTRHRRLLSLSDLRQEIAEGNGPKTPIEFLITLNDRITDRIADVLDDIDEQVDGLEHDVLVERSHLLRPKIADLRRQIIEIRRYLAPQREALYRLQIQETPLISPADRLHFREASDRIIRYIEDLDSARERASISQEELTARLAEQMDRRMYVLSVVAVIFLPITFLTGLLGINVGGVPGAQYNWAFEIVCGIILGVVIVTFGVLRRKKWM